MSKTLLLLASAILLSFSSLKAQKAEQLEEFTASNGITYKIGDQVKLARGSDTNGKFVYVNIGGWAISSNPEQNRLPATNAGLIVTIKKIKRYDTKRYKSVIFIIGGGNITNYTMDIENAIATCEIENCKKGESVAQNPDDKYEKLKKLKELFDQGALTEKEYAEEKKKILN